MKFTRMIFPLPLLALSLLAQDVRYNFAANTDFTKYRTYKWVEIKGAERLNQLAEQQVKQVFDAELAKKGLTQATGDTADLLIGFQPSLASEKQVTMYDSGWGYGPGWGYGYGYGGGGGGFSTSTTETIHIGQLDLDMYDPVAKQLVWRGSASKTLDPKAKPEKRQKNLTKAAAKLLKNYPPSPKKG